MNKIPAKLRESPFTLNQAENLGLSRYSLKKLVAEGTIELIARGVYRATHEDISEEDQFRIATLRVGTPSAICLVSALSFYGLVDSIPKRTWIMVPVSKRTKYSDLKLLRTRNPNWLIGIEKHQGYAITALERSVVDVLCARTRVGTQIGIEALRKAVQSKKTTLGKLMDMAVKLDVSHRVRPYIEALA